MGKADKEITLQDVLQKLRNYGMSNGDDAAVEDENERIVLAAPAHGRKQLLRAYMNGGNIGKISLKPGKTNKTTGISSDYARKYKGNRPVAADKLREDSGADAQERLEALVSDEYLAYVTAATKAYSTKDDKGDKERTIETLIMDYRNQKYGNAAIDMEMQYSVRDHFGWTKEKEAGKTYVSQMKYKNGDWYNEYLFDVDKDTSSPRVDLMVLNDRGVGFVELKVNNENWGNLTSHINHMNYILTHKKAFIEDAQRRIDVLDKLGLLEPEMADNLAKWRKDKSIWCGLLFVGNREHLEGARDKVSKEDAESVRDILCSFVDVKKIKNRSLNMCGDTYVPASEFIKPEYKGIFEEE